MRMALALVAIILVASVAGAAEQRDGAAEIAKTIGPFVGRKAIAVGRVDMVHFDLAGLWAKAAQSLKATGNIEAAKDLSKGKENVSRWQQRYVQAGGDVIYFVVYLSRRGDPDY